MQISLPCRKIFMYTPVPNKRPPACYSIFLSYPPLRPSSCPPVLLGPPFIKFLNNFIIFLQANLTAAFYSKTLIYRNSRSFIYSLLDIWVSCTKSVPCHLRKKFFKVLYKIIEKWPLWTWFTNLIVGRPLFISYFHVLFFTVFHN